MLQRIGSLFGQRPPRKSAPAFPEPVVRSPLANRTAAHEQRHSYTKIFRWRLPDGETREPQSVEVVGSFTRWQKVPLHRDGKLDAWHAIVHHIPGNRTHHYMLLVDGQPVYDQTCDGLAIPHGLEEERYQLQTEKGPRVLMLFAQTK